jgi:hypothetical protein
LLPYLDHLTAHPSRDGELRYLLNELTIGETCLFRSMPQIDSLRKVILPEFAADKTRQSMKRLRIWSAGCSTGEEPYTLAMTMMEESEGLLKGCRRDRSERSLGGSVKSGCLRRLRHSEYDGLLQAKILCARRGKEIAGEAGSEETDYL